jgi:hypothetical protein
MQTLKRSVPSNVYFPFLVLGAALTPCQGLPNFIVYWYPKYLRTKRLAPNASWCQWMTRTIGTLLRQDSQSDFATSTKSPVNSRLFGVDKASRQGAPPTSLQTPPPMLPTPPPPSAERPKTVGEYLRQLRQSEAGFDKDDDVSSYSSDFEFGDDRNDKNATEKAPKTIDKPELQPEEMVVGQSPQAAAPAPASALMANILENDDPQPASTVKPNSTKLRQGFIKDFVVKKA